MFAFGDRLRKLREERGITQSGLGEAIGVRQSTISEIERGSNQPSMVVLRKLADFFGVKPGYFLDDEPVEVAVEVAA